MDHSAGRHCWTSAASAAYTYHVEGSSCTVEVVFCLAGHSVHASSNVAEQLVCALKVC